MKYYLRMGSDYLEDAKPYRSKAEAIAAYRKTAEELDRYGQSIEATLHSEPLQEYPDFVLTYTRKGAVKCLQA